MTELKKGDLVICNELMGFVVDVTPFVVKLNTEVGERSVSRDCNIVRLSTAHEIAFLCSEHIMKGVT